MSPRSRKTTFGELPRGADPPGEIVTVDEASLRHDGEWVLMRVTGLDEQERVPKGHVVHHSKSRREISQRIRQLYAEDPSVHVLVTLGGTRKLRPDDFREDPPLPSRPNANAR
jgi:hypothetical protein